MKEAAAVSIAPPAQEADLALILGLIKSWPITKNLSHQSWPRGGLAAGIVRPCGPQPRRWSPGLAPSALGLRCTFTIFRRSRQTRLYLEDLFVRPAFRGLGVGKALLGHLARVALERDCGRFEWAVLDWNTSARNFYESLGAEAIHLGQLSHHGGGARAAGKGPGIDPLRSVMRFAAIAAEARYVFPCGLFFEVQERCRLRGAAKPFS